MQTPVFVYFALLLLLLFLSLVFSGSETAFLAINRLKLKSKVEAGDPKATRIQALLLNPDKLLGVILLGNNLTNVGAATLVTYMVATYVPRGWVEGASIAASTVLTLVILIFCELTPKLIAATHAERVSRRLLLPIRFFTSVLYPFSRLGIWFANRLVRLFGLHETRSPFAQALSAEEIRALIAGTADEAIGKQNKEMLSNVFDIGATQVREIMIPRTDVIAAEINDPIDEVLSLIQSSHHSRIPVYRGKFDNILGILYVKDLLHYLQSPREINLKALLRPVHFVPDTAPIDAVMRQLQSMRLHMVGVVDEFGGVDGILTLEDLLEEIVGEIRDELDTETESIRSLGPELYSVSGTLAIKDFNRMFPSAIPESREYSTVVGFLQARTGRLLKEGETVRYQDLTFAIEKADRYKILALRVRVPTSMLEKNRPVASGLVQE